MSENQNFARILDKFGAMQGSSQDVFYYWGVFRNTPKNQFAVIKISGECIENSLETLAEDISDLYHLGLIPVITHGWGKALTKRFECAGITPKFVNLERYTDRKVMDSVEKIAQENLESLFRALYNRGIPIKPLTAKDKIIIAQDKDSKEYGRHNGNIIGVNTRPIFSAIDRGFLPLISPIGVSNSGRKHYNLNSASVGAEIARAIDPVKYVMITGIGGVYKDKAMTEIIHDLILRREYEQMVKSGVLQGGMKKNVDEAMQCLTSRQNGVDRCVQIIGPGNLLQELFSRRGIGTSVRLGYETITEPMEMFDRSKIKGLVEKVFGASLKESFFEEAGKQVHLEPHYKGIAVVIENPIESDNPKLDLIDYIDILAVDPRYEGNGLGSDLIHSVTTIQPKKEESYESEIGKKRNGNRKIKVFWRSKTFREDVNDWYYRIADGHWQYQGKEKEPYNLFWIGLTRDEVGKALAYARSRPCNFEPRN